MLPAARYSAAVLREQGIIGAFPCADRVMAICHGAITRLPAIKNGRRFLSSKGIDDMFIVCSKCSMRDSWLLNRLEREDTTDDPERWRTIFSRLRGVDESTSLQRYDKQIEGQRDESRSAAPDCWLQFEARACQQNKSRGRATANKTENFARRNVASLRAALAEEQLMNSGELNLASIAVRLLNDSSSVTDGESKLVQRARAVENRVVSEYRDQISQGKDVLGAEFCRLRSREKRRQTGATYTPPPIVNAIVSWAKGVNPSPNRVIDPGVGSGRFISEAARNFPTANLVGIDIDPLALLMARANACVLGYMNRLHLALGDYRDIQLPECQGSTLFIGNPPYVRHHEIADRWKTWFAATADRYGFAASKLSGLHIHFFLRTRELAKQGDYGAFITSAEWLDVNYGSALRHLLADGLGGSAVHVIDPKAKPFADALTTGAVTCFRIGERKTHFVMRAVDRLEDLTPLDKGRPIEWEKLATARKWSVFLRDRGNAPDGFIELGEIFRVHRGQVTGPNEAWIAGDTGRWIPRRFLRRTITKARELLAAGPELITAVGLKRVVDLPISLDELSADELRNVRKYLAWAKTLGAHNSYVAKQRRSWWAVELREPSPILVTYMARQAPAFVLNTAKARNLNIAHGLYPREPIAEGDLKAIVAYLRRHTTTVGGRVYAGGLVKFEPKELEQLRLPRLQDIYGYLAEEKGGAEAMVPFGPASGCAHGDSRISE